eukprot:611111-Pleurochrysis_carterae.AAC.1
MAPPEPTPSSRRRLDGRASPHAGGGGAALPLRVCATALGEGAILTSLEEMTQRDMELSELISIPLSLALLGLAVRSWRLLLLPIVMLVASLLTSFGLLWFMTLQVEIVAATLSLMSSLCVALSLDYALFYLSRYQEATRLRASSVHDAVVEMIGGAGHNILVSGAVLCISFFILAVAPSEDIRGFGLGAGLTAVTVMAAYGTLFPALLLQCAPFLSAGA